MCVLKQPKRCCTFWDPESVHSIGHLRKTTQIKRTRHIQKACDFACSASRVRSEKKVPAPSHEGEQRELLWSIDKLAAQTGARCILEKQVDRDERLAQFLSGRQSPPAASHHQAPITTSHPSPPPSRRRPRHLLPPACPPTPDHTADRDADRRLNDRVLSDHQLSGRGLCDCGLSDRVG
jgi:hypothetical protein